MPSPSGLIMLLETSTQNSMFVSTRLVCGALNCWGPARSTMTTRQDQGRHRLGEAQRDGPDPARGMAAVVERQGDPPAGRVARPSRSAARGATRRTSTAG